MATSLSADSTVKPIMIVHPLASLRPEEVTRARDIVAQYNPGRPILWKIIALKEPPKAQVIEYPLPFLRCTVRYLIEAFSRLNMLVFLQYRHLESFALVSTSRIRQTSMRRWLISLPEGF